MLLRLLLLLLAAEAAAKKSLRRLMIKKLRLLLPISDLRLLMRAKGCAEDAADCGKMLLKLLRSMMIQLDGDHD